MSVGHGLGGHGLILAGQGDPFQLVNAIALRENMIRVQFNREPKDNELEELNDASLRANYLVEALTGTSGYDGEATRDVNVASVEKANEEGTEGRYYNLWLDRSLSPYPGEYVVTAANIIDTSGNLIEPGYDSAVCFGTFRGRAPNLPEAAEPARDMANPYTATDGDYANDAGLVSFKKRILRRLLTRRGAFAHLPNYGVGTLQEIKQLARDSTRRRLEAQAEEQISLEPETSAVRVRIVDTGSPGVWRFVILVKMRNGLALRVESPTEGVRL